MSEPLVSIGVPVHNGADFLAEALESILAQTQGDFEVVVSDNASIDATPDIVAEFVRRDSRVRASRVDTLVPATENFNRAGGAARGTWLKFLCHDDLLRPTCLERIAEAARLRPDADVALIGNYEEVLFANGYVERPTPIEPPTPRFYHGPTYIRELLGGSNLKRALLGGRPPDVLPAMTTSTIRRDRWEQYGRFDLRFAHCDTFLWHRLLVRHDFVVAPEPLSVTRIHAGQDTASVRRESRTMREYRTFFPEFLAAHGDELRLSRGVRFLVSRRYLSVAATEAAILLMKRRFGAALRAITRVPAASYPFVLALVARNYRKERRRTGELSRHVPLDMIYPG